MNQSAFDISLASATHLRNTLNAPSPYIGAQGPPNQDGPERVYVEALKRATPEFRILFGKVVDGLLLEEFMDSEKRGAFQSPYLLFNLLRLLQEYALPGARPALLALIQGQQKENLQNALRGEGEDLYRHALLALAVNQPDGGDTDFWKRLLAGDEREYAKIAVAGLREAGWKEACEALPLIAQRYKATGWGSIDAVAQLLVYYYPDEDWPHCAEPYCSKKAYPELWRLLRRYKERLDHLKETQRSGKKKTLRLGDFETPAPACHDAAPSAPPLKGVICAFVHPGCKKAARVENVGSPSPPLKQEIETFIKRKAA